MQLTAQQAAQFERDGFLVFPGLFSAEEAALLKREAHRVSQVDAACVFREGSTGQAKSMFRLHEPDGPTASPAYRAAARCPRILGTAQQLLRDDEVYLHHCKVNMKAAIAGRRTSASTASATARPTCPSRARTTCARRTGRRCAPAATTTCCARMAIACSKQAGSA